MTAGHKEVDTEVRNPEQINAAIQHYETSQTIIQPAMPTSVWKSGHRTGKRP